MKLPFGLTTEKVVAGLVVALAGALFVAWVQNSDTAFGKLLRGEK